MGTNELVRTCVKALDEELRDCVGDNPSSFYNIIRYHLGWVDEHGNAVFQPGGKMLRPVLCLLSCQAAGGDYTGALPAAAAIEMMHNFSLVHDDIQDQSPKRRHRPTVWWLWGQAQAITAGDGLHVMAHLAPLRLLERGAPPDMTLATLRVLDMACLDLCEGQYLDLSFEGQTRVGLEDYLAMIGKKTAALFAASTRVGAMLGTKDDRIIDALGHFGEELGMAFQIQDDVLGIWGTEQTTGKPSLDDIRARKKSLPIVHALATTQGQDKETLEDAYRVGAGPAFGVGAGPAFGVGAGLKPAPTLDDETVASVLSILDTAGSRDYCQSLAKSYWKRASSRLAALPLKDEAAAALEELAGQLVGRQL